MTEAATKKPKSATSSSGAELPPGTFVPFAGGPTEIFEREKNSPFADGYSLIKEGEAVRHLIDAEDPDPDDPMFYRFTLWEQRNQEFNQMRAAYRAKNSAPEEVSQQEATSVTRVGGLVKDEDDQMTLHTKEALRMFMGRGRDPEGLVPAIPGGRGLGSALRTLWSKSVLDNPYADWALILADQYLHQLMDALKADTASFRQRLDSVAAEGLQLSVLRSRSPVPVSIGFKSPYGYTVAHLVVAFDYFVRVVRTLIQADLLTDDQGRTAIANHTRRFRADCHKVFRFERFLKEKELAELSRRDWLPTADAEGQKRVAAVTEYFGNVPPEVFTGAVTPRHSRRNVRLTPEDRALLAAVAEELDEDAGGLL